LEKIRAISSMDMKHVSIAGTWTGIFFITILQERHENVT